MGVGARMLSFLAVLAACGWGVTWMRAPADLQTALADGILKATGVRGGLVVHLGCGEGKLTAALGANERYVVHGLAASAANVEKAREHIRGLGLYGRVSVQQWKARRLPYTDNLVNLLVSEGMDVSRDEMMRVLAPDGVAYVRRGSEWTKIVKPRPAELDEWTHYLHDASNNAVAHDSVVGLPYHLQWVGEPKWARSHEHLASVSAAVSSGGRIFYIVDRGPTVAVALEPRWFLEARDAFSGVLLWERPIGPWEWHLRGFRSGPANLARRLVAEGDRVYVTLGYGAPVSALDAATGETIETYERTKGTEEILFAEGALYLVVGDPEAERARDEATRRGQPLPPVAKRIVALDADTGRLLWERSDADTAGLMPTTLAVAGGRTFLQSTREIICVDATSGQELWRAARPVSIERPAWSAPTLVVYEGVVLAADREAPASAAGSSQPQQVKWTVTSQGGQAPMGELIAFSAETGERVWSCPARECYNAPPDVLVAGGLVWTGDLVRARDPGMTEARDPKTGKVRLRRPPDQEFFPIGMAHHRCYRNKATDRYILVGRAGTEFLDVASGEVVANHWVRGACQYGVLACNGLLYAPSHSCACYIQAKLNGFNALAPRRETGTRSAGGEPARLQRGPAYGKVLDRETNEEDAWPTYRHDPARTGHTTAALAAELEPTWHAALGGKLSSVVVTGGRLFVAQVDAHAVHALDANDGTLIWSYTAGGRIDSPPTVHEGLVLFGSADGYVYCLRAADGALVWRFRAAPEDRRVVAYDQVESVWPVPGNVLVEAGVAYAAAGRSSYLDGGIYVYRLDPATGRLLSEKRLDSRDPETGKEPDGSVRGFAMEGVLPDVLLSDGGSIYMRHVRLRQDDLEPQPDATHLQSPAGFVDDSWWHRTYWIVGNRIGSGWGGWPNVGNNVPAGRILAVDETSVFGYGRTLYNRGGSHVGLGPVKYQLFATDLPAAQPADQQARRRGNTDERLTQYRWTRDVPLVVRAMVLAGDSLLVAGPPDLPDEEDDGLAALQGGKGGRLWVVSTQDGRMRAEHDLPSPPTFDGMAAGNGRLYLSTTDGNVLCFAGAWAPGVLEAREGDIRCSSAS